MPTHMDYVLKELRRRPKPRRERIITWGYYVSLDVLDGFVEFSQICPEHQSLTALPTLGMALKAAGCDTCVSLRLYGGSLYHKDDVDDYLSKPQAALTHSAIWTISVPDQLIGKWQRYHCILHPVSAVRYLPSTMVAKSKICHDLSQWMTWKQYHLTWLDYLEWDPHYPHIHDPVNDGMTAIHKINNSRAVDG